MEIYRDRCQIRLCRRFDIGGNKYRVIASVDFGAQILVVDQVLTHQEYDRETI